MNVRKSARVVLINDRDEVFMFRNTSHGRIRWILPGGGVEPGESWEEAAIREMWEETGIEGVSLGPLLWIRRGINGAGETAYASEEQYYLVRCGMPEISNANQLPHEREDYRTNRWWSLDDMRASPDVFYPEPLADLLAPVIAAGSINTPIDLPK